MSEKRLSEYVINLCQSIGINIEMLPDLVYRLHLPESLVPEFQNQEHIDVTFVDNKKEEALFLQEESFLIKRFASILVKEKAYFGSFRNCTKSQTKKSANLYLVYKISVQSYDIDEVLVFYSYDFSSGLVEKVDKTVLEEVISREEAAFDKKKSSDIVQGVKKILPYIEAEASVFEANKDNLLKNKLTKEVERINDYYSIAKKEHESSYTHASYEDFGVISKEKNNLIEQQVAKFTVDSVDLIPIMVIVAGYDI